MNGDHVILTPIFNDWDSCRVLLQRIDDVLFEHGLSARVLAVDDGSSEACPDHLCAEGFRALTSVHALRLRRNLGHQRAIAIGLSHVYNQIPCRVIVVMDADGEDDPRDVPRLIEACATHGYEKVVFAERTRRSESICFRMFYFLYRVVHQLLTGIAVRFGNFSAVPRNRLNSLVAVAELWSHFAAAVLCSRQPWTSIPTRRAKRIAGRSKLNFIGLVTHGLSAISVFSEIVGIRVMLASLALAILAAAGIGATIVIRFATTAAIPGWATYVTGIFVLVLLQSVMLSVVFSFVVLSGRRSLDFLPLRDFAYFIENNKTLYEKP